jgi:hypothetical protein
MPKLFVPPAGPLAVLGGAVQIIPPDTVQGPRQFVMKLIIDPAGSGNGINIPVIEHIGFYENDSGQVQLFAFANFGQGQPDGTPAGAIFANSQVRQAHPAIVYNLDSIDPWTQEFTEGSGVPSLIVERVDQLMVYDTTTVQTIVTQNEPLNTDPDGSFQGAGQILVYAIDNYDGEINGAVLSFGAIPDVTLYGSIDSSTPPPDFSAAGNAGGVHRQCHTVRIYGGPIQTDVDGNYVYDDNGNVVLSLSPNVWADVQYIDVGYVIDDDGQERYFTLTNNPVQDNFPYPTGN